MQSDLLTKKEAFQRSELIKEPHYDLQLFFSPKSKKYKGIIKIYFELTKKTNIRLDTISRISKLKINNKSSKYKKTPFYIILPKSKLEKGENVVDIEYEANYDHTGDGLHQFIDPADKEEYLYANFEPFDAHRMFPCFDQPDIKATYQLTVSAPKHWAIISNSWSEKTSISGKLKITQFKKTPKFSTYLFHLSAGPYYKFSSKYKKMPINLYCRKSLRKHVPASFMFKITKQGLKFYEKFFSHKYPFEKYDQIFVPEFNSGAMENVGAVTFTERLLTRHTPTQTDKSSLANVVLHEMAHMWFGDLVTMKWWDDLWLNESFADYMSYLAMVEATEFKSAWQDFYARKAWGYYQDQLPTTHPIATHAEDTNTAFANFDGISYSKGAAVLKQLMFFIGKNSFRQGLKNYFNKYAWQNTRLTDFLDCLEKASKKSLKPWFNSWIKTTGVNEITSSIAKKTLTIDQTSKNKVLRKHKTKIALFYNKKPKIIEAFYQGRSTKIKIPKSNPNLVHLNHDDHDFVKDTLDNKSLNYVMSKISSLPDLTKQMIYGSLWNMLRDSKFSPKKYLDLVIENAPKEKNQLLLERLFLRTSKILVFNLSDSDYLEYSKKLNHLAWQQLKSSLSANLKTPWFALFTSTLAASKNTEKAINLLSGKTIIKNLPLDLDKKWELAHKLALSQNPRAKQFISQLNKKDKSDQGAKWQATIQSSILTNKQKFWAIFQSPERHSLDYLRNAMAGFFNRYQKEELEKYANLFFKTIQKSYKKDRRYAQDYFNYLFPSHYVSLKTAKQTKSLITKTKSQPLLNKSLKEALDEMQRNLKINKKYN